MKNFISTYKDQLALGTVIVAGITVFVALIALFIYNNTPKVVYQPADACQMLSLDKAQDLLGEGAILTGGQDPTNEGNLATSRCGYTDGNNNADEAIVAAITVRSGFNDNGVTQNRVEFTKSIPTDGVEEVENVGEKAYFNQRLGQLNILNNRDWIIISYGIGSDPTGNTVDDAVTLARKVL